MVEETKLKIGDVLICHTEVIMNDGSGSRTTIGKSYEIIKMLEVKFIIKNDSNEYHYFRFENYEKWFYSLKEARRKKLKKIQNAESW